MKVSGEPLRRIHTYTANRELATKTVAGLLSPVSYSYDVLGNLLSATLSDGTQIEYVIMGKAVE
jgi:YD repeat-containing protein